MARTEDDLHAHYANPPVDPTAVDRLTDHVTTLVAGTHHHRRGWVPAAATIIVVILLGGAVAALQAQSHPSPESAATTPTVTSPSSTRTSTSTTASTATTGQVTLQRFIDLAPRPGTLTNFVGSTGSDGLAQVVYDDGHGAAQITVRMTAPPSYTVVSSSPPTSPGSPCGGSNSPTCTTSPDGTTIVVSQGLEYPNGHTPNATRWSVDIQRPDKVTVAIQEWNAPTQKGTAPTRSEPPFTIAELTTIATSPTWTTTVTPALASRAAALIIPTK